MIPYRNCEIFASVIFYFAIKIICSFVIWFRGMYKKQPTLTSIPERNECEDEYNTTKWVPKKKHEVLKAKYKCLKKLFQIYDASVIGILPESYGTEGYLEEEIQTKKRRKKRSHRTKTDACAGTTEVSSGDVTQHSAVEDTEKESIATAVIRDLKMTQQSCTSTQIDDVKDYKYAATQDSKENVVTRCPSVVAEQECEYTQTSEQHPIPYLVMNEKRRLTRFQCFIHRLFGLRQDRCYKNYVLPNGHVYAASDNNITHNYNYGVCEKRRRRGIRFRRLRRPKKIQSEIALRDVRSPMILTYVQSVQRNCLMDTTPRQCPIVGCRMIFYGIINYNDHLNLCHFVGRRFICHYCHEGFEKELDKLIHENEHIGITKLQSDPTSSSAPVRPSSYKMNNTQTDPEVTKCEVPEDKLKKIVSFFEKINDPDQMLTEIRKNRFSDLDQSKTETAVTAEETSDSDKRTVSCVNLNRKESRLKYNSGESQTSLRRTSNSQVGCHFCGEKFDYRRQLSLHVDLEHRVHDKFSKFHSCAGILNTKSNRIDMVSEDGRINVQSISRRKSDVSLSGDPSMNTVYTSVDTIKKPSVVDNIVKKVRTGINSYKWEPGTKIIRV
ncbi:uncharacterized protein LOC142984675 [Anticarsia gemmatalis]|uniref:uncharacterized protein LOC142984675 n=1 Tax=Anticarsia gemmatalis TaxID=129554 RepID=UPI003F76DF45